MRFDALLVIGLAAPSLLAQVGETPLPTFPSDTHSLGGGVPRTVVEEGKLMPSDGEQRDHFGFAVSLHGDTLVVGAPFHYENDGEPGRAFSFRRDGHGWIEEAELIPADIDDEDRFGVSVSIRNETALIGAYEDDDQGTDSGSAYVFVRNGTSWSEVTKLVASDGGAGHGFGVSVSLSGDTAAVGAPFVNAVYVFQRMGTTWTEQAKLTPVDGQVADEFGAYIAIDGDTVLIGALGDDDNGPDSGSAYIFVRVGTAWTQQAKLLAQDGVSTSWFGASVGLEGDTAVIGAPLHDSPAYRSGAAYVFVRNGTTWTQRARLTASDASALARLGSSVSIAGDDVVVGASRAADAGGATTGAIYLFRRNGTTWEQERKILASDGATDDRFGMSVSMSGEAFAVGANLVDHSGSDSGAAYAFHLYQPPAVYCTAKSGLVCGAPSISYVGESSAAAATGFYVFALPTRAQKNGLLMYSDGGRANLPFDGGTLCLSAPIRRSVPVFSEGTPGSCDGEFILEVNSFASGGVGGSPAPFLSMPGTQVNCQWWGRDSLQTGSLLSDAMEYFVGT